MYSTISPPAVHRETSDLSESRNTFKVRIDSSTKQVFLDTPTSPQIGFRDAAGHYLVHINKKSFATPGLKDGDLIFADGLVLPVLMFRRITIRKITGTGSASDQYQARFTRQKKAVLFQNGTPTLVILKGNSPLLPSSAWGSLEARLKKGAHLALKDGRFWTLMFFRLRDKPANRWRWVPKKHSSRAFLMRLKEIQQAFQLLPASQKRRIRPFVKTIAVVATIEGSFHSKSPPPSVDSAASIGIFQWAMKKASVKAKGTSMHDFFKKLKERATAWEAIPLAHRSEEGKLFVDTWHQCTAAGLDITPNRITINGNPATGIQVERLVTGKSGPMNQGALKRYQLVAAVDWIDHFSGRIIRPGPVGAQFLGLSFSKSTYIEKISASHPRPGEHIILKRKRYRIEFEIPPAHTTVADLFRSDKAMAMAVMLGVNRPNYVQAALWKALNPTRNLVVSSRQLMDQIISAQTNAQQQKLRFWLRTKAEVTQKLKQITNPATRQIAQSTLAMTNSQIALYRKLIRRRLISTANLEPDAQNLYEKMKELLWPVPAAYRHMSEAELLAEFQRQAMLRYKPRDAKRFNREQRFSIVEAVFTSPYWRPTVRTSP